MFNSLKLKKATSITIALGIVFLQMNGLNNLILNQQILESGL